MQQPERNVQISMHNIPVGSSIGAAMLIALLLIGMFLDLPGIRPIVVWGSIVGIFVAVALIVWRRRSIYRG